MRINELEKNNIVTISLETYEKNLKIDTQIQSLDYEDIIYLEKEMESIQFKSYLVVDLIKDNNKVVNFLNSTYKVKLTTFVGNNESYTWKDIKILKFKLPKKGDVHIILSNEEAFPFNNRKEIRLYVGRDLKIKNKRSGKIYEAFLRDISISGAGFIIDDNNDLKLKDFLHLVFYEPKFDKDVMKIRNIKYSLDCMVVRFEKTIDNKTLVGCQVVNQKILDLIDETTSNPKKVENSKEMSYQKLKYDKMAKNINKKK